MLLSVKLDLSTRILANDHHVPDTNLHVLVRTYRDDLGGLRLLLGGVGQYDPGLRRLLALDLLEHHPRSQRLELHLRTSSSRILTSQANLALRGQSINSNLRLSHDALRIVLETLIVVVS